jgi:hypothetical protein
MLHRRLGRSRLAKARLLITRIFFVPSAVARKLETDSGVRIGLPVFVATV